MAVVFVSGTPVLTKNVEYKEETVKTGDTEAGLQSTIPDGKSCL
jgi:hypothetical protein